MAKPVRDTFWGRLGLLVRGVFLYNTVYWKRASDGLKPPRISSKERQQLRPVRNLELIKPREKPRAKVEETEDAEHADYYLAAEPVSVIAVPVVPPPALTVERQPVIKPFKKVSPPSTKAETTPPVTPTTVTAEKEAVARIKVKRRRVRHRTDYEGFGAPKGAGSFIERFFKKK